MTYADICYYKAEAALLHWGASENEAHTFFMDGVEASFALAPYNITSIPPSYEEDVLSFANLSVEQKLEKIAIQKWIQLFGRNMEAFAEWRRMGYPELRPGPNPGSTNGRIPRRGIYSSEEAELNKTNYEEAVDRMSNGDSFLSKVWWDKN